MGAPGRIFLRLFVAGDSPDSAIAIANLRALFPEESVTPGGVPIELEIIDVQSEPARAALDRVLVTPTLLKLSPAPPCRILGNLRNRAGLLGILGLSDPAAV